jgi:signal transduction histidine kinase
LSAIITVREGNYDYVIDVQGKDELAQLGRELNIMAERLKTTDEMRRRFVSDASHELKTPLAAIKLLSDSIVQNEMDATTVRDFVNDIGKEADRLVKITEDLLSISKLEGKKAEEPYIVDMKDVVTNALQMLRLLAENSGVSISHELDESCFVLATEDDLHQIVFNLIENAIKYNNLGGSVRVRLAKTEKFVLFITEDTGVGIPEEDLPFIFDRFYRVDKARSREAGGSGLGLSIVMEAVTRHGGTVEAMARDEGGSRFIVRFPISIKGSGEI